MRGLIKNLLSTQTLETAVLASLTALAAVILFPVLRQRLKLQLDPATLTASVPFIGLGALILSETSLSFFNIVISAALPALIFFSTFFVLKHLETGYLEIIIFLTGFSLLLTVSNAFTGLIILAVASLVLLSLKTFSLELNAFLTHLFDALTTLFLLRQGFSEGMVLTASLIDLVGVSGVLIAKLVFVAPAIIFVSKKFGSKQRTYYLTLIWLIGLSPAVYNLLFM